MPAAIVRDRMIEASKLRSVPFHRFTALTGILTTIAAGTASAGHVIALRNGDLTLDFHIARLRTRIIPIAGFTALQEARVDVLKMSAFSALHTGGGTGGADVNLTPRADNTANTTVVGRVAGDAALTAGTHTVGALIDTVGGHQPAATAGVHQPAQQSELLSVDKHPVEILKPSQGLLWRYGILGGAGGTFRLFVSAEGWLKDSSPT